MTRGPVSEKAFDAGLLLAKLRGAVYLLRRCREAPADFEIANRQGLTFIRVKMSRCLHRALAEIEEEYREAIFLLRMIPFAPSVRRELWICSRYGRWRFFEILEKGMVELAMPI